MTTPHRRSTRVITAGILAVTGLAMTGCNSAGPEEGTDVEDISEGEILESSPAPQEGDAELSTGYAGPYDEAFRAENETYAGQEVTLSAEVTDTLSTETFVIGGAAGTAVDPLLVVEVAEIPALDTGQVVEVTGTVQQDFDVAAAEEQLGIDLEDELYAPYAGEPYLEAASGEVLTEE